MNYNAKVWQSFKKRDSQDHETIIIKTIKNEITFKSIKRNRRPEKIHEWDELSGYNLNNKDRCFIQFAI